jgi:hypothetical protein
LALDLIGEVAFQHCGDASMQFLTLAAQQCTVGGVLNECMFEQIGCMRSRAAAKQQFRFAELRQRSLQCRLLTLDHRSDERIGEFATEHRTDLRDFLRRRCEPI